MKIAIAGYGIEGKASYKYWSLSGNQLTIVDERESVDNLPDGASVRLGRKAFDDLSEFDLVIRTAGLAPSKLKKANKIWSATNQFFAKCPAPIIGVTGTKGKGTTSSLITSILRAAGKTVYLVGNIGSPALEVLPNITDQDIVVYELSSFQLWDLKASPSTAVVLMIEPDHLDVHVDFDDYIKAKSSIAKFQKSGDRIVFHESNTHARQIAELSKAEDKISFPFDIGELADAVKLQGAHNLENASAAIAAVKNYVSDKEIVKLGLSNFTGLDHRLKLVGEVKGVEYYDDSIATTSGSAIAALKSFDKPIVLILGGSSKGTSYKEIVKACQAADARVIAIGQTGREIVDLCRQYGVTAEYVDGLMGQVVKKAAEITVPSEVVILSPASASFDQYKNYIDRGEQFIVAVNQLAD